MLRAPSLEYLAGFFDGEGNIGIYAGGGGGLTLRAQLTQSVNPFSTGLLGYIRDAWGGSLSVMHRDKRKQAYNWQVGGARAINFIEAIRPHLILRAEEADIALEWWDGRPSQGRQPNGRIAPKSLEKIAWDEKYRQHLFDVKQRVNGDLVEELEAA